MTDPEIGRWMSDVFTAVAKHADAMFTARQKGHVKGFRKAMKAMIEMLQENLAESGSSSASFPSASRWAVEYEASVKKTCEHCGYAKVIRGKFQCQNQDSLHVDMNVGAAEKCRRFTPRGKQCPKHPMSLRKAQLARAEHQRDASQAKLADVEHQRDALHARLAGARIVVVRQHRDVGSIACYEDTGSGIANDVPVGKSIRLRVLPAEEGDPANG